MAVGNGRLGTSAEAVFVSNAMSDIVDAAEASSASGGLTGCWKDDGNGRFVLVSGVGSPEVGMYFPSEGTHPSVQMADAVRSALGEGLLVVVDPYAGELAIYMAGAEGVRSVTALMSERDRTQMA